MFKEYNEYNKSMEEGPIEVYNKDGNVRQVNKGGYEWRFDETEDKTCIIFEIKIPKYLETSQIDCDL